MENVLNNLLSSVGEYPLIVLLLYLLAVLQPSRILLFVALFLACGIISSFIGYPQVYLQWFDWVLTGLNLLPAAGAELPAQYLSEVHKAFIKGVYVATAVISGFFMVFIPVRKLRKVKVA